MCFFFIFFHIFQDSEAQISPTCEARVKPTLYKMLRTAQEVTTIKQTYAHITMSTIVYPTTVKHSMSLPLSSAQVQDSNDESCSELREVRGGASGWGQGRTGTQKPLEVRKKTMDIWEFHDQNIFGIGTFNPKTYLYDYMIYHHIGWWGYESLQEAVGIWFGNR